MDGGNQTFKGAATVYRIATTPQRPKGAKPRLILPDSKGGKGCKTRQQGCKTRHGKGATHCRPSGN